MQQTLFDKPTAAPSPAEREFPPASANADPESSHLAERKFTRSGKRGSQTQRVADLVRIHPGLTSLELAEKTGLDRHLLAKRLPDARGKGWLVNGPARTCRVSGSAKVETWNPVNP